VLFRSNKAGTMMNNTTQPDLVILRTSWN